MSKEDELSMLKYVPRYREIKVYVKNGVSLVEKHVIEVSLGKGKGVVIEQIMEDDDVENKTEASTSKVTPLGKGSNESVNAPVVAVDALVLPVDAPVIALEEQLERV
nr:transposase, MuDR, MULE transposase domain protein [Tanacetum cinerariifolium]